MNQSKPQTLVNRKNFMKNDRSKFFYNSKIAAEHQSTAWLHIVGFLKISVFFLIPFGHIGFLLSYIIILSYEHFAFLF